MVKKFSWLLAGAVVLWAAALPQLTAAQDRMPKRITPTLADSTCIGNVSKPICAVETWIACYARSESRLCSLLGVNGMRFNPEGRADFVDYVIVDILPVTTTRIFSTNPERKLLRPGDLEIRVMTRWGNSGTIDQYSFFPEVYFLKRGGNAWRLAAWTNDVSVTCYYAEAKTPPCKLYFYDEDTPWVHDRSAHGKYP